MQVGRFSQVSGPEASPSRRVRASSASTMRGFACKTVYAHSQRKQVLFLLFPGLSVYRILPTYFIPIMEFPIAVARSRNKRRVNRAIWSGVRTPCARSTRGSPLRSRADCARHRHARPQGRRRLRAHRHPRSRRTGARLSGWGKHRRQGEREWRRRGRHSARQLKRRFARRGQLGERSHI